MTAESDFRKNTRAIEDVAKKLENLTKVLQSMDRTLNGILSYAKSEADAETERLQQETVTPSFEKMVPAEAFSGMTVAEAAQNIGDNTSTLMVCHWCFTGIHKAGVINNDKCYCCNKSHRKAV